MYLWDKGESQTGATAQAKLDRTPCPTYSWVPPLQRLEHGCQWAPARQGLPEAQGAWLNLAPLLQVPDLLKSLARITLLPTFTPTRGPQYWLLISNPPPQQQSPRHMQG